VVPGYPSCNRGGTLKPHLRATMIVARIRRDASRLRKARTSTRGVVKAIMSPEPGAVESGLRKSNKFGGGVYPPLEPIVAYSPLWTLC
jgi:hypothetical protein